jgi:hypothetical protein
LTAFGTDLKLYKTWVKGVAKYGNADTDVGRQTKGDEKLPK